jgi:tetratricopeptide (TPR) repeat protein
MKPSDWFFWACVGICNLQLSFEIFSKGPWRVLVEGSRNPRVYTVEKFLALLFFVGWLTHHYNTFAVELRNPFAYLVGFGAPLVIGPFVRLFPKLRDEPVIKERPSLGKRLHHLRTLREGGIAAVTLQQGQELFHSAFFDSTVDFYPGVRTEGAESMATHPKILQAEQLMRQAIDLTDDPVNKAIAITEIGLLHRMVNDLAGAQKLFEDALELHKSLENRWTGERAKRLRAYRETAFRMGELQHARNVPENARHWYEYSLKLDMELGHDQPEDEEMTRRLLWQVRT